MSSGGHHPVVPHPCLAAGRAALMTGAAPLTPTAVPAPVEALGQHGPHTRHVAGKNVALKDWCPLPKTEMFILSSGTKNDHDRL